MAAGVFPGGINFARNEDSEKPLSLDILPEKFMYKDEKILLFRAFLPRVRYTC
jgi:hypothetical protein